MILIIIVIALILLLVLSYIIHLLEICIVYVPIVKITTKPS